MSDTRKWVVLGDKYVLYRFNQKYIYQGGSSIVFKGFSVKSLKNILGESFAKDIVEAINAYGVIGTENENKLLRFHMSNGTEYDPNSDESLLIYSLPLEFLALKTLRNHMYDTPYEALWENEVNFNISHKHLLSIKDSFTRIKVIGFDGVLTFLVTDWLDGENITESGLKSLAQVEEYFNCVLEGVQEIHNQDKIHRDLKPGNLIVTKEGNLKIIDFALVLDLNSDYNPPKEFMGTPLYAPPEQLRNERLGFYSDIWSLGVILYELVFGKEPFSSAQLKKLQFDEVKEKDAISHGQGSIVRLTSIQDELEAESQNAIIRGDIDLSRNNSVLVKDQYWEKNIDKYIKVISKCLNDSLRINSDSRRYLSVKELISDLVPEKIKIDDPVPNRIREYLPYLLIILLLIVAAMLMLNP